VLADGPVAQDRDSDDLAAEPAQHAHSRADEECEHEPRRRRVLGDGHPDTIISADNLPADVRALRESKKT
jgi:hypothetical protein